MSTTLPSGPDADDIDPQKPLDAPDIAGDPGRGTTDDGDPDPINPVGDALSGRIEVSGQSIDEAARSMERFYGGARFRAASPDRHFSFRFASLGDANVTLRLSSITGGLTGDVAQLDDYIATWCRDGTSTITTRGRTVELSPGQPVVLPSSEPFSIVIPPGRQNHVHLARAFLDRIATERHGGQIQAITFRHDVCPGADAIASWKQVISEMTPVITDADTPPLIRIEADLAIARSFLTVFAWHTQHVPAHLLTPRLARVRAAVEFLHENAHLPITPADAALAVGLHTRSMQNSFQRHLATSPTEYLRRIRLDRVRRDLVEHTPETATVGDLARAWGFGNQGRFASAYQERFGEKPNETLRR